MTDEPSPAFRRAEKRAAAKTRGKKNLERGDFSFPLFLFRLFPREIAKTLGASAATVRRMLDKAIEKRRSSAPERSVGKRKATLENFSPLTAASH
jgi:hypothetical protein